MLTEDDIRRIIREELARHDLNVVQPPAPTHYPPRHFSRPAQPYYPGGPWPVTCSSEVWGGG